MKLILYLLLGIYLSFQAKAQNNSYAELDIRLADQSLFTLSIDQQYYPYNQYIFSIRNIMPGCHTLNITRLGTSYYPVRPDTLPVTIVRQVCLLPDTKTVLIIDPRGQAGQTYMQGAISTISSVRDPGYSLLYPEQVFNTNDSTSYKELKDYLIDKASYDRVKSDIIKESAFQFGITTEKLAELLPYISFDKDRVMLATYCYGFCTDPSLFWKLKKAFIFSGTYQQLIEKVDYYYPGRRVFK